MHISNTHYTIQNARPTYPVIEQYYNNAVHMYSIIIVINNTIIILFIGSKLCFSRISDSLYGAFWRCSRVRLYLGQSEPIWFKSGVLWLWVHCRRPALADFRRDPRSSESCIARWNTVFLSGKQRTISPISRRPNFTKFEHKTSISVVIKTFATEFWKFYRKWSFFQKKRKKFLKTF